MSTNPPVVETVLPKQWRHWVRKAGLCPHGGWHAKHDRRKHTWWYLEGHGYKFRVNMHGHFQLGDSHDEFDRWALCKIVQTEFVPRTEEEFVLTVKHLVKYRKVLTSMHFQDCNTISFTDNEWKLIIRE